MMENLLFTILDKIKKGELDKQCGSELLEATIREKKKCERSDVAIIGIAGRFPNADTPYQLWDAVINKQNCISSLPLFRNWDSTDLHNCINSENEAHFSKGGYLREIDKFDHVFFNITPYEALCMDPSQRLMLETAYHSLEDAGYTSNMLKNQRVGVYIGYSSWPVYAKLISQKQSNEYSDSFTGGLPAMIPARVSYYLDLKGPAMLIDTACSSSLCAIHIACKSLYTHDCDLAIAGGVNIRVLPYQMKNEYKLDAGDYLTKTFDEGADGTVWGEGVASLVLKPLDQAIRDCDDIYAVISSSAINHDGKTASLTAPNVNSQADLLKNVCYKANVQPDMVSLIEAHGTGTSLGDTIEIQAIKNAFPNLKQQCAIGSLKTNIGHLDGTSGIAGVIKLIYALRNGQLPPTLNMNLPNHNIDFIDSPVYVNRELKDWNDNKKYCIVSSFGMSGTNCSLMLESPNKIDTASTVKEQKTVHILALSGKSETALISLIKSYIKFFSQTKDLNLYDVCYTACVHREHFRYRLAVIAKTMEEVCHKLKNALQCIIENYKMPDGCYVYHDKDDDLKEKLVHNIDSRLSQKNALDICFDYCAGLDIEWQQLYKKGNIVHLPLYPFDKIRSWYDFDKHKYDHYFFEQKWECSEKETANLCAEPENYLIIGREEQALFLEIKTELIRRKHNVVKIVVSDEVSDQPNQNLFFKEQEETFKTLFHKHSEFTKIVYVNYELTPVSEFNQLKKACHRIYAFVNCLKALVNCKLKRDIEVILVGNGINCVTAQEQIFPINSSLSALGKAFNTENAYIHCRCIDIDTQATASEIVNEFYSDYSKYFIALRNHNRFKEYMHWLPQQKDPSDKVTLKSDGVYIITGGFGGIGSEISYYFSNICPINLVFFNRSALPVEESWEKILKKGTDESLCRKLRVLMKIKKLGSKIFSYQVDVSNPQELNDTLEKVRNRFSKINGIIHSAGVAGSGLIEKKEFFDFEQIIKPKIYGTWLLGHLTQKDKLDFFYLFSSAVSIFGDAGHSDYMAANAYLDAYAFDQNRVNYKTKVINWTGWKEIGMSVDLGVNIDTTFKQITTSDALRCFNLVFNKDLQRVMIGQINEFSKELNLLTDTRIPFNLSLDLTQHFNNITGATAKISDDNSNENWNLLGRESGEYSDIEKEIAFVWHKVLGHKEINIYDNFFEIGGDSIKAVQVILQLNYAADNDDIYQMPVLEEFCAQMEQRALKDSIILQDKNGHNAPVFHMKPAKFIEPISALNGFFFKDCFYNAFFSILKYYNCSLSPYLINEILVYEVTSSKTIKNLKVRYVSIETIETLCKKSSITIEESQEPLSPSIKELIDSIDKGYPVIVRLDCYYEPIRQDMYHQTHWSHAVLVYGYDISQQKIYIYEQENINSTIYKPNTLSFDDLYACWNGYIKYFYSTEKIPHFLSIQKCSDESNLDNQTQDCYLKLYLNNMQRYNTEIFNGIDALTDFVSYVQLNLNTVENQAFLDGLYHNILQVLKAKQSEKFIIDNFNSLKLSHLQLIQEQIIQRYTYIVRQLGRYKSIALLEQKRKENIIEKLKQIVFLEKDYYSEIMKLKCN